MLRVDFPQGWYALSYPAMEDARYDTTMMRPFARLRGLDNIPDETTILNFRRLLETYELVPKILKRVNTHLRRDGRSLRAGTIVGATIIAAPSSTKSKDGERDPEMHHTKKDNQWHFGMKAHIGVCEGSGLVHHVECMTASGGDVTQVHKLPHSKEGTICGDSGYTVPTSGRVCSTLRQAFWVFADQCGPRRKFGGSAGRKLAMTLSLS